MANQSQHLVFLDKSMLDECGYKTPITVESEDTQYMGYVTSKRPLATGKMVAAITKEDLKDLICKIGWVKIKRLERRTN